MLGFQSSETKACVWEEVPLHAGLPTTFRAVGLWGDFTGLGDGEHTSLGRKLH